MQSKFTGEHPCRSEHIYNFIEIALCDGRSPVNLLHVFRTPFAKNTSGWLLLYYVSYYFVYAIRENNKQLKVSPRIRSVTDKEFLLIVLA